MRNFLIKYAAPLVSYFLTIQYRIFASHRIKFGKNFVCNWKFKIKGNGKITFGDNVKAWAHKEANEFYLLSKEAEIIINDNVQLNGASMYCMNRIEVGSESLLASTMILDNDFHNHNNPNQPIPSKPVSIGKHVWLAGQTAVMKGVSIGDNSILGFRGVAFRDIPPNSIALGNPAVVVKGNNTK